MLQDDLSYVGITTGRPFSFSSSVLIIIARYKTR
jgi:hypothetical protein